MLYLNTITPQTLELLIKLQSLSEFSSLRLVGGTALALQIGHRVSNDIDLFGEIEVDDGFIYQRLKNIGNLVHVKKSQNINIIALNGIKVDIVNYPYPWLCNAIVDNPIRMADMPDIAAMKLSAITGRGSKKDFIDLFFLLNYYSLPQMLEFYKQKYSEGSEFLVLRSLVYYNDAEDDELPVMIQPVYWDIIKETIKQEVKKI
jgi:hypothetical protein